MTAILDFLRTIRPDKWLHALTSVVIFAAVHFSTGNARIAFAAACASHVVKKAWDYRNGLRDWNDIGGDIAAGIMGAVLAWACIPVQ